MYQITIQKEIENPSYDYELKKFNDQIDGFSGMAMSPRKFIFTDVLFTELTEIEWETVKKAIIGVK